MGGEVKIDKDGKVREVPNEPDVNALAFRRLQVGAIRSLQAEARRDPEIRRFIDQLESQRHTEFARVRRTR